MKPFETLTDQGKARRHRRTVAVALDRYGIKPMQVSQLAIDTNFVYRVRTASNQRFVLRIHRQDSHGENLHALLDTKLECWWVQQLALDGLPVAGIVENLAGEAVTVIDDLVGFETAQTCVLFEWLPGQPPDDAERWYWVELGELAARLHEQAARLVIPSWAEPRRWDSVFPYEDGHLGDGRYDELLTPKQRDIVSRGIVTLDAHLSGVYADGNNPVRLLHGDLHDGNVHAYYRKLSVFDFEDLIVGYPEHDLGVALYGPYYNDPDFKEVAAAMRQGYERHATWPVSSVEQLEPLFAARALGLINFCLALGSGYLDYVSLLADRVARFVHRQA